MLDYNGKLVFDTAKRTRQYLTGRHNCLVVPMAPGTSTIVRLLLMRPIEDFNHGFRYQHASDVAAGANGLHPPTQMFIFRLGAGGTTSNVEGRLPCLVTTFPRHRPATSRCFHSMWRMRLRLALVISPGSCVMDFHMDCYWLETVVWKQVFIY